jgi:hypothetical protein
VALAAAEARSVHTRKLEVLLDDLESENEAIRGTIDERRAQLEATTTRVKTLLAPQSTQCY